MTQTYIYILGWTHLVPVWLSDQIYSSEFNSTDRGSIVKAMFVMKEDNELHPYWLHFFFQNLHHIKTKRSAEEIKECILSYVKWMIYKSLLR